MKRPLKKMETKKEYILWKCRQEYVIILLILSVVYIIPQNRSKRKMDIMNVDIDQNPSG